MEKKDILALLEALCDRPLSGHQAVPSAESPALYPAAAKPPEQSGNAPPTFILDPARDADKLTAVLASILSSKDAESAQSVFDEIALRSTSIRLDAQSALAFLDGLERSPQSAPNQLVEQVLAPAAPERPATPHEREAGVFSAMLVRYWSAWRWRVAAACTVLLVAGGLSSSVYWEHAGPTPGSGPSSPEAGTSVERSIVGDAPAKPKPALATVRPCKPTASSRNTPTEKVGQGDQLSRANSTLRSQECDDATSDAARQRAESDRDEVAARAAAEAARKIGETQADRDAGRGSAQADHAGPMIGAGERKTPAATLSVPASPPNLGAAPSAASPVVRPSAIAPSR